MNKKSALAALILSAGLALTACTAENNPFGSLFGNEQTTTGSSDSSGTTTTDTSDDDSQVTSTTTTSETEESDQDASGGNPDTAKYIEITVSEDKYFYENHEISYEDLIQVLDGLDGNTTVMISDENATLNAYESLTKALEEREIIYEVAG